MQLVGKGLAGIVLLHGQHALKILFLSTEDLHFFLVRVQVLLKSANCFVEIVQLALKVSGFV